MNIESLRVTPVELLESVANVMIGDAVRSLEQVRITARLHMRPHEYLGLVEIVGASNVSIVKTLKPRCVITNEKFKDVEFDVRLKLQGTPIITAFSCYGALNFYDENGKLVLEVMANNLATNIAIKLRDIANSEETWMAKWAPFMYSIEVKPGQCMLHSANNGINYVNFASETLIADIEEYALSGDGAALVDETVIVFVEMKMELYIEMVSFPKAYARVIAAELFTTKRVALNEGDSFINELENIKMDSYIRVALAIKPVDLPRSYKADQADTNRSLLNLDVLLPYWLQETVDKARVLENFEAVTKDFRSKNQKKGADENAAEVK